ncbi:hypothetical protein [uncultured Friedmanniella sp.]|uniref:hypothetical protein n=1 Tax=uncultured Friedmanniella sp. TaxID=335381 RepID=UPI0035CB4AFE
MHRQTEGSVAVLKLDHGLRQHRFDYTPIVEEQSLEEGQVQLAASVVAGPPVQLARLVEQAEVGLQYLGSDNELSASLLEPLRGPPPLDLHLAQAGVDLLPGKFTVSGEVEESLLLDVQAAQLLSEAILKISNGLLLIAHDSFDKAARLRQEVRGEL